MYPHPHPNTRAHTHKKNLSGLPNLPGKEGNRKRGPRVQGLKDPRSPRQLQGP